MEGTLFLVGGPANIARADGLIATTAGAPAVNACDLGIAQAAALLRHADLFVGPDSAPMNLAAAGETTASIVQAEESARELSGMSGELSRLVADFRF
jgi:ADP-heptose:LPS heptosyltransferase